MGNIPKRRTLSCVIALALASSLFISGCAPGGAQSTGQTSQENAAVAAALQEKYGQSQTVDYAEGQSSVARDHTFVISYGFDPVALGMNDYAQIASLYYDAELTQPVASSYDWASTDKKSYSISPKEYPGWAVYTDGAEGYPYGVSGSSGRLFDKGENADWGNAGTMYLATRVDLVTGQTLAKPVVQVVTVKGELDTPSLSLRVAENGQVQFSWNAVKGAKAYYVVELNGADSGKNASGRLIGHTSGTTWSSGSKADAVTGGTFNTNKEFMTYQVSEDDWLAPATAKAYEGQYDPEGGAIALSGSANKAYSVIAVNESGSSVYSNMLGIADIAALAPATIAYNMERLSEEGFSGYVKGVAMMPSYRWIVMCDGKLSQRLVNYDFGAATEETEGRYNEKADGTGGYDAVSTDVLKIPYTVDGTAFTGTLVVSGYDKDNKDSQIEAIKARQDSLKNKTGDIQREVTVMEEGASKPSGANAPAKIVVKENVITANSALSEYLALSMVNGMQTVDLSGFPQALDQKYLVDAWSEAFYQNPLVLGVSDVSVSRDGKTLYLKYEDAQATRESKQAKITEKVKHIVPEIIDDTMTAREKEFAINQYLCDTVTYDNAALENAEKYNYKKVDSSFYDSFTAYGALVKGVGVCASYSASFKLLADAAGLDSVVVTGYLDGSLGHAWNRVNLGSGQWAAVDSTNNDIDVLSNAILNAPDSAIASTLVEDDLWIMDSVISQYGNQSDRDEYYHVKGLFFDQGAVVSQIVDQLASRDTAVVRTNYKLTDGQFYDIGKSVVKATGNSKLSGFYWMGVVVISSDPTLVK